MVPGPLVPASGPSRNVRPEYDAHRSPPCGVLDPRNPGGIPSGLRPCLAAPLDALSGQTSREGPLVALVAVAALVAAVVQAATGLGFALVLGPAVFALLDPEPAIVAITVLGVALNGLVLFTERRRPVVAWEEVGPILAAAAPGAVCGVFVL